MFLASENVDSHMIENHWLKGTIWRFGFSISTPANILLSKPHVMTNTSIKAPVLSGDLLNTYHQASHMYVVPPRPWNKLAWLTSLHQHVLEHLPTWRWICPVPGLLMDHCLGLVQKIVRRSWWLIQVLGCRASGIWLGLLAWPAGRWPSFSATLTALRFGLSLGLRLA